MIVFGGSGNMEVKYLELKSMIWKTIKGLQFNRFGHSANLIGKKVFLFGGADANQKNHNNLHSFDVNSFKFEEI